jgi:hypothetical protein
VAPDSLGIWGECLSGSGGGPILVRRPLAVLGVGRAGRLTPGRGTGGLITRAT